MKFKDPPSIFNTLALGASILLGALPAASQEYGGCDISTLSETPIVEEFVQQLNNGNYQAFTGSIDVYDDWPSSQKNELSESLSQLLQNRPISSCILLQRRQYSEEFVTEVIALKFETTFLYFFVASAKVNDDWMVARLQVESSFDNIFAFIR